MLVCVFVCVYACACERVRACLPARMCARAGESVCLCVLTAVDSMRTAQDCKYILLRDVMGAAYMQLRVVTAASRVPQARLSKHTLDTLNTLETLNTMDTLNTMGTLSTMHTGHTGNTHSLGPCMAFPPPETASPCTG